MSSRQIGWNRKMADFPKPKQTTNFRGNFQKRKINSDYSLKKRPPKKHSHHENAVYVTTKSDIKSLMKKCENLFNKNVNEIVIYAVGAAIERGINLALQFTEKYPSYKTEVNTTTISLIDDLEPLNDDLDYELQRRDNSVVHIRLSRENVIDILSSAE